MPNFMWPIAGAVSGTVYKFRVTYQGKVKYYTFNPLAIYGPYFKVFQCTTTLWTNSANSAVTTGLAASDTVVCIGSNVTVNGQIGTNFTGGKAIIGWADSNPSTRPIIASAVSTFFLTSGTGSGNAYVANLQITSTGSGYSMVYIQSGPSAHWHFVNNKIIVPASASSRGFVFYGISAGAQVTLLKNSVEMSAGGQTAVDISDIGSTPLTIRGLDISSNSSTTGIAISTPWEALLTFTLTIIHLLELVNPYFI